MTANDIKTAKNIVKTIGGYREKNIIEKPYTVEIGSAWNSDHKCIIFISKDADADGYCNSCEIDLVTKSIVG